MILTIKNGCLNRLRLDCDSEIVVPNDSKEIVVPEGITRIEWNTFQGCDKVKSFSLPKTLKSIGSRAFENCRSIKELTIPDGVIEIEYCAFAGCTDLTTIRLPGSVKKIDPTAFMGCFNLRNIVLAEDNQSFVCEDGLLMDKQKTMVVFAADAESIVVPDGIEKIGNLAFCCCKSLCNLQLPDSVRYVGSFAFDNCCNLHTVTFPGVKGCATAFQACKRLRSLWVTGRWNHSLTGMFKNKRFLSVHIEDISSMPADLRRWAAIGFAEDGGDPDSARGKAHLAYIKTHVDRLIDAAFSHPELLYLMCREGYITPKSIDAYLKKAKEVGNVELQVVLIEYLHSHIGTEKMESYREKLQMKQEVVEEAVLKRTIARRNKVGISDMTFVISGRVHCSYFYNRDSLHRYLLSHGAKLVSRVGPEVDYVIKADQWLISRKTSPTAKLKRAKELSIKVITPDKLLSMAAKKLINNIKET